MLKSDQPQNILFWFTNFLRKFFRFVTVSLKGQLEDVEAWNLEYDNQKLCSSSSLLPGALCWTLPRVLLSSVSWGPVLDTPKGPFVICPLHALSTIFSSGRLKGQAKRCTVLASILFLGELVIQYSILQPKQTFNVEKKNPRNRNTI